jgi:NADPH:quinone reductase-like Zn-dependent oxidoreductase
MNQEGIAHRRTAPGTLSSATAVQGLSDGSEPAYGEDEPDTRAEASREAVCARVKQRGGIDRTTATAHSEERMKAIVHTEYGSPDVLQLKEVATPVPNDDEVRIRVQAVSVNGSDWEGLTGKPFYARIGGLRKPRHQILGSDVAGRVEMVGKNIREFQPGDEVFGEIPGYHGGFAEYACAPEKTLARKPASLTFEQAAAIPQGGVIALQGIRVKGQVQPGQKVLINGAGGSAGTFAVQLAKSCGAEVTAVDNAGKLDFLRSLGADHVVDYAREDFTSTGKQYDLILDVIAHRSVFACARALRPRGRYFVVGGDVAVLFQSLLLGPWIKLASGKRIGLLVVPQGGKDLVEIAGLCEAGKLVPVIDRLYSLAEVPEALRYVGEGRHKGKVVITLESDSRTRNGGRGG